MSPQHLATGPGSARPGKLEAQRQDLGGRRERLELPAIVRDLLASLVNLCEKVLAAGSHSRLHSVSKTGEHS